MRKTAIRLCQKAGCPWQKAGIHGNIHGGLLGLALKTEVF
ncbi:hypothetical protein RHAB21_02867 [Pseudorhizobium halotolerans]|uniref:Uncharacterized protein n=1 Tax=Pseudorhizobium halotolerans TaxID=1233081 RepID=A0ABM8PN73_9HYPH|nr:hypothetical protein RHAB21_02867 [Pseudorhizobium halotolerans]